MNTYTINGAPNFPIIFLDIDGVLAPAGKSLPRNTLDKDLVQNLNELLQETGAKVVISSTWRKTLDIAELEAIFKAHGFTGEIIGTTPILKEYYTVRGNEIYKWMKDRNIPTSDYTNYLIIDDDSDMLFWQRNHFLNVDGFVGLNKSRCYIAKRMLKGLI